MTNFPSSVPVQIVVPLHVEDFSIERRKLERDVRLHVHTVSRAHLVDEPIAQERVEIERVALNHPIDVVPPVREEGDTTIIPVVEEIVVVERRLVLKEEIRMRRVRTIVRHRETVVLREQQTTIERAEPGARKSEPSPDLAPIPEPQAFQGSNHMADETVVAVYDTAEHATLAVRDLEAAGVPSSAISQHASGTPATGTTAPVPEKGFWSSLFGGEPENEHDTTVYNRSLESGSTVVTVKAPEQHLAHVMDILERHNPVDIDERTNSYGLISGAATAATTMDTTTGTTTGVPVTPATTGTTPLHHGGEEVVQLSEEQLAVGKRLVNRGTTRVRRFVVETPVDEAVTLHSEHVSVERRPVTIDTPVTNPDFTDRTIEVTESDEEAVVAKTVRVKEEVVINKSATDRVETVHDTVRHEDVEITHDNQTIGNTGTTSTAEPVTRTGV